MKQHVDGSGKGQCAVTQALLPKPEHESLALFAKRLGTNASTFARAAMRVCTDPGIRQRVTEEIERVQAEKHGAAEPRFKVFTKIA